MKHPLLLIALVVVGTLASVLRAQPPAAQGTGTLRPVFTKGETFAFQFTVNANERRTGGAAAAESLQLRVRQAGTLRLNVLDIDEDGIATMSAAIAAMEVRIEALQPGADPEVRQVSFVHLGDAPAAAADPADVDVVSAVARVLSRAVIRFEVLPTGRVRQVTGLEALEEAAGQTDSGSLAMGVFSPNSISRMLERLWRSDEPRAAAEATEPQWLARKPGDQWTLIEERTLAYNDIANLTRTFTCETAADPAAAQFSVRLAAVGKLLPRTADHDPTIPVMTLHEWTEEGTVLWDATHSRVAQRREKCITDAAATLGPRSQRSRLELQIDISSTPVPPLAPAAAQPTE